MTRGWGTWGVNHTWESLITKPLGFSYPPFHTPNKQKTPWRNFLSVFGGGTLIVHFCAFGCGLLFGLQSFLFSSLVPFAQCFSFIYLFIYLFILPYTKRCKGNSLLQIKIPAYFPYSGSLFSLPPSCHSHHLQLKGTPISSSPHTLEAPSRKYHLTSSN